MTALNAGGGVQVTVEDTDPADGDDGTDTLTGIEEIQFSDMTLLVSDLPRVDGIEARTAIGVARGAALPPVDLSPWFDSTGDLTFEVVFDPTSGQGLSFDGDGTISGTPTGLVSVTVTATEAGAGNVSARHTFTVGADVNGAPELSGSRNVIARTGATNVSVDAGGAFTDPDGDTITFEAQGLTGAGLTINNSTGVISGSAFMGSGDSEVTVTADDGFGGVTSATFTLRGVADGADMVGTAGNDLVFATPEADVIDGLGGDDIVVLGGNRDDHEITGGYRDGAEGEVVRALDVVETGTPANSDEVRNVEVLRFDGGDLQFDQLFAGAPQSRGSARDDVLRGGASADTIQGLAGHDSLHGEGGADRLEGGRGNDTLLGGAGMDTAVYAKDRSGYGVHTELRSEGGSTVTWHFVTDRDGGSTGEGRDGLSGIEFLEFDGTRVALGDLTLNGVHGTGGVDAALSGGDGSQEIFGFAGNDTLRGGGGGDFLEGGEGNDMLQGDGGDDMIYGDAGMDTAVYAGARAEFDVSFHSASRGASSFRATVRDMVTDTGADEGTDSLTGISAIAFMDQTLTLVETATSGSDILFGNGIQFENRMGEMGEVSEIPEVIDGMGGDDLIFGFEGSDVITGGAGDDTIHGGDGRDVAVFTGAENDYTVTRELRLEDGNVVVWHVVEHNNTGTDGRDELTGVEILRFSDGDEAVTGLNVGVIDGSGLGDEINRPGSQPTYEDGVSGIERDMNGAIFRDSDGNYFVTPPPNAVREVGGHPAREHTGYTERIVYVRSSVNGESVTNRQGNLVFEPDFIVAKDDVLYGFDGSETLHGRGGDDRIHGLGGNDTIHGGPGNDWIIAGDGNDTITGGWGSSDIIRGGAGVDSLYLGGERMDFNIRKEFRTDVSGNRVDWYSIQQIDEGTVVGTHEVTGVERFFFVRNYTYEVPGDTKSGRILQYGNNPLTASQLADDSSRYSVASTALPTEGAGHTSLAHNVVDETIRGGEGDDTLWGNGGGDTLEGGAGDDTLVGGTGNDTLEGGLGNDTLLGDSFDGMLRFPSTDTAVFEGNRAGYEIVVGEGGVTFVRDIDPNADGDEGFDELRGIEALRFKDETLTLVSTATGNGDILLGGGGVDGISGGGGGDVIFGGGGDDVLSGDAGDDVIDGGAGTGDRVEYTGARDDYEITERRGVEYGLNENGERVFVTLFEVRETSSGEVDHVVNVEAFRFSDGFLSVSTSDLDPETVIGSSGDDNITSSDRANTLSGGSGNDTLSGGSGNDALRGGPGDDTLDGGDDMDKAQFVGHWADPGTGAQRFEILHDGTDFIVRDIAGDLGNEALAVSREGVTYFMLDDERIDILVDAGGQGQDTLKNIEVIEFLNPTTMAVDRTFEIAAGNTGTSDHDLIVGSDTATTFTGSGGDDVIVGGAANGDIAVFSGSRDDYTITLEHRALPRPPGHPLQFPGSIQVHVVEHMNGGSDGRDELIGIEMLRFGSSSATAVSGLELDGVEGRGTLTGGAGGQAIIGRSTDDTLNGGAGDDTLEGGGGDDTLDGGMDMDTAVFSGNSAGYSISAGSPMGNLTVEDVDDGTAGNGVDDGTDTLTNVEVLRFADREIAVAAAATAEGEILRGTADADSIDGLAGDDLLFGFGGDDTLTGGGGDDVIDGGAGSGDKAVFSGDRDGYRITEERRVEGTSTLGRNYRVEDIDSSDGDEGVDTLRNIEILVFDGVETAPTDSSPEFTIIGSSKEDLLYGGVGGVLDGGGGVDTVVYTGGRDEFTVTREWLFAGDSDVPTLTFTVEDGDGVVDRLIDIERLRFVDGGNSRNVPVRELDRVIAGDDGDNDLGEFALVADATVSGLGEEVGLVPRVINRFGSFQTVDIPVALDDIRVELDLGTDDTIHGHGGNDSIRGGSGNDTLRGGEGRDRLFGGPGDDTLDGGAGRDRIDGGAGVDTVVYAGTIHDYQFTLNPDDFGSIVVIDSRVGGNFDEAGALDDARARHRALDEARDRAFRNATRDDDILIGGDGHDSIHGYGGDDWIHGFGGNDTIIGGEGNDTIRGGAGDDTLILLHARDRYDIRKDFRLDADGNRVDWYTITHNWGDRSEGVDEVTGVEFFQFGINFPWHNVLPPVELSALRPDSTGSSALPADPLQRHADFEDARSRVEADLDKARAVEEGRALDEGRDELVDVEIIRFGDGREIRTADIEFGSVTPPRGTTFEFLSADADGISYTFRLMRDSTQPANVHIFDRVIEVKTETVNGKERVVMENNKHVLTQFDPREGDRISIADIPELRGLTAELVLENRVPVTRLTTPNSDFVLDVVGDFVADKFVAENYAGHRGGRVSVHFAVEDTGPWRNSDGTIYSQGESINFDIHDYIDYVDPNAGRIQVASRPEGASSMAGHDGLDVFQFLTAEDSAGSGRTTILEFDPADGDIISLADIGGLRGLTATLHLVTLHQETGVAVTRLSAANSNFELDIVGDFVSGSSVAIVAGASPGTEMNSIIMDGAITPSTRLSPVSHDPERGIDPGLDIFDHINYIGGDRFPVGGVGADEIEGGAGNDTLTGGPGNDSLDGGEGVDTAFYFGGVRNFQFAPDAMNPDHLTVTDANARNYPGEGVDTLMNIEKLQFEGGGQSRTVVVKFGSMPIVDLVADAGKGSVLYGPGGGFTLRGGRGADIFQFLTAGDSPDTDRSRIIEFDPDRGDIIALADIPDFRNVGAEEMIDGDGLVFTRLSAGSDFELDVYGVGAVPPLSSAGRGILDHVHIIGRDDHLIGGEGDDGISGREGNDRLEGGGGSDRLEGGPGDDTLFGEGSAHGTNGVTDDDVDTAVFSQKRENYRIDIEGSGDSRVVHVTGIGSGAADGVDTLRGIEQLEFAGGGEGQRIVYKLSSLGTADGDTLIGDGDAEGLEGGAGDDVIRGLAGDDRLFGGAGDDILDGGAGDDALFGGADSDTAVYAGARGEYEVTVEVVWLNLGLGSSSRVTLVRVEDIADDGMSDGSDEGRDTLDGVEFLRFADTGVGREVDVSRLSPDTLTGTEADDTMIGGGGGQTVMGGGGYDIIFGGADDDILDGGADDDTAVLGGAVGDYLFTRDSSDDLVVTDGADGGEDGTDEGRDTLRNIETLRFGGLEGDVSVSAANIHIETDNSAAVTGHATENNIFHGAGGGFSFTGGSGADVFQFLVAADSPTAGMTSITGFDPTQGDRIVLADITALDNLTTREASGDTILENTTSNFGVRLVGYTGGLTEGEEYVHVDVGDRPAPTTGAGAGNDTLTGTAGTDEIDGGAGMDTISGGAGTDTLRGGAGDDVLVGGAGVDTLTGGTGDDFLYGQAVDGTGPANEADVAVFAGHRDDYEISVGGFADGGSDRFWVSVRDVADAGDPHGLDEGRDVLVDIDVLRFLGGGDVVNVMVSDLLAPTEADLPLSTLNRTVASGTPIIPFSLADFFSDPTGGGLTFDGGTAIGSVGWTLSPEGVFSGTGASSGTLNITITANNDHGMVSQTLAITVRAPGAGERATQVIDSAVAASGKPVEIDIRSAFHDSDNDPLTFELSVGRTNVHDGPRDGAMWRPLSSVGLEFDPDTGLITGTPTESVVEIVVRANDGTGDALDPTATTTAGRDVLPTFTIHSDPIKVTASAPENMTVVSGMALAGGIDVAASFSNDADLTPTYTVYGLSGTGLTFDSNTNMISGSFTSTEREKITLAAEARGDVEEHSFFIEPNVAPRLTGKAPVLESTGMPVESVTRGVPFAISLAPTFADDNLDTGDRLTFTNGGESGVSLITVARDGLNYSITPSSNATELVIVFTATDEAGESVDYTMTLDVAPPLEGDNTGDTLSGGDGNDAIRGNGGDDTITGGGGDDRIDGGDDSDTAVYAGTQADYTFTREIIFEVETVNGMPESDGGVEWLVVEDMRTDSPDGRDLLRNVEELDFGDNMDVPVSGITAPLVKITGDRLGNKIFGDAGDQEIRGGGGGDEIYGRGGEDTVVFGGDRSDYEIERRNDIQADGTFRSVLIVTNKDLSSGEGAVLRSIELLDFADEQGVRTSEFSIISGVHGDGYDNTLEGGAGAQDILGGGGDDSLKGGEGDDFLNGGEDWLEGRPAAILVTRYARRVDGTLDRDAEGNRIEVEVYLAGDTAVYDDNMSEYRITKNLIWGVDLPAVPDQTLFPGFTIPGTPAVTSPRTESHSVEDIADDGATGGTDEGRDTLKDIEYLQFADATLQRTGNSVNDQRVNLAGLPFTHLTGTEEGDTIGDTDQRKGLGVGDQIIDGRGGIDTVVYEGDIADFAFTRDADMRLTLTDADARDGTDEGTDALANIETIRFGGESGTDTVETANIHIFTGNPTFATAQGSGRSIFYGEGGGFTFTGGSGADTFQFLTAADSTAASTTTIRNFDQAAGDRVLLADIGDLRGLSVTKPTGVGETVTRLSHASSGFVVDIAGDHDITDANMGEYVRYIGGPGDGDDVVTGGDGADVIEGFGGNDRIDGGGGRDTAVFAAARTEYTITSELLVTGSAGAAAMETIHVVEDNNRANGDEGRDELRNIEILRFAGVDVPVASLSPAPVVVKITGDAEDNTLTGMAGDQVIEGGPGDDTIDGGAGTGDVAVYAGDLDEYEIREVLMMESGQAVTRLTVRDTVAVRGNLADNVVRDGVLVGGGGEGEDTLSGIERLRFKDGEWDLAELGKTVIGTGGNDATLMGGMGNDIIDGGAGDDNIGGGEGGDIIGGGAGNDMIDGGAGHDTAVFRGGLSGYGISASLANGVVTLTVEDTADSPVDEDVVSLVNVEQLSFFEWKRTTTRLDDTDSSATDSLRHIIGSPRYDETALEVVTDHVTDRIARKNKGAGAEIIVGDDQANGSAATEISSETRIDGGAGNDWIFGLAMDDHIQGGLGDDMIFGGAGTDTAYFMAAREDYIIWQTGTGAARITHVQDRDTMTHGGHEGRDQLVGVENIRFASHAAEAISSLAFDSAPAAAASVVDNFVDNPPDSVQYVAGGTVNASAWFDVPMGSTAEYGISSPAAFTINSATGVVTAPGTLTRPTPVTVTVSTVAGASNTFDDVSHTVLFVSPPDSVRYVAGGTVDASTWFGVVPVFGQDPEYTISSSAPFTIDAATGVITAPGALARSTLVTVTASRYSDTTEEDVSHTFWFTVPADAPQMSPSIAEFGNEEGETSTSGDRAVAPDEDGHDPFSDDPDNFESVTPMSGDGDYFGL